LLSICGTIVVGSVVEAAHAESDVAFEFQVKARFVVNFSKFTTWPKTAFADENSPLHLCTYGPNPFGRFLQVAADRSDSGRELLIREISGEDRPSTLLKCHLVYIDSSLEHRYEEIASALDGHSVLTVTEHASGGLVNFLIRGGKIRFEIQGLKAKEQGLSFASGLLKLAIIPKTVFSE
jgi:hypothetical protein